MRIAKSHVKLFIFLWLASFCCFVATPVAAKSCQPWPEVLKNMPLEKGKFVSNSGLVIPVSFRLANTSERLAQGFQFACAETINTTNILFDFSRPVVPSFHMNNVVAPLDIAFINELGEIINIYLMKTYRLLEIDKPTYRPSKPALYAFEARAGFFSQHKIKVGDKFFTQFQQK